MELTKELINHIAELAHLKLTDEEIKKFQKELSQILDYVNQLNEVDTSNVEPLHHPLPITNIFRKDEVKKSIDREEALKNAPESTEEFFKVPKVI